MFEFDVQKHVADAIKQWLTSASHDEILQGYIHELPVESVLHSVKSQYLNPAYEAALALSEKRIQDKWIKRQQQVDQQAHQRDIAQQERDVTWLESYPSRKQDLVANFADVTFNLEETFNTISKLELQKQAVTRESTNFRSYQTACDDLQLLCGRHTAMLSELEELQHSLRETSQNIEHYTAALFNPRLELATIRAQLFENNAVENSNELMISQSQLVASISALELKLSVVKNVLLTLDDRLDQREEDQNRLRIEITNKEKAVSDFKTAVQIELAPLQQLLDMAEEQHSRSKERRAQLLFLPGDLTTVCSSIDRNLQERTARAAEREQRQRAIAAGEDIRYCLSTDDYRSYAEIVAVEQSVLRHDYERSVEQLQLYSSGTVFSREFTIVLEGAGLLDSLNQYRLSLSQIEASDQEIVELRHQIQEIEARAIAANIRDAEQRSTAAMQLMMADIHAGFLRATDDFNELLTTVSQIGGAVALMSLTIGAGLVFIPAISGFWIAAMAAGVGIGLVMMAVAEWNKMSIPPIVPSSETRSGAQFFAQPATQNENYPLALSAGM